MRNSLHTRVSPMHAAERGSVLLFVLIGSVAVAGWLLATFSLTLPDHVAARRSMNTERAYRAAESAISYYLGEFASDPSALLASPAPQGPFAIGDATFSLVSASVAADSTYWKIVVRGESDGERIDLAGVVGFRRFRFPTGLVIAGTNDDTDITFSLKGSSQVVAFDSSIGTLGSVGTAADASVYVQGSADLVGGSSVTGDLTTTGAVDTGGRAIVSGATSEASPLRDAATPGGIAEAALASSKLVNDNTRLATVFGTEWTPIITASEVSGDLVVTSGGTYTVPQGDYRFRSIVIKNGSTVVFDTSSGNTTIAVTGSSIALGNSSSVLVDPNGSAHHLMTVLNSSTEMTLSSDSVFGQAIGEGDAAKFSRILAVDSSTSPVINAQAGSRGYGQVAASGHVMDLGGNASWLGAALVKSLRVTGSASGPAVFGIDTEAVATVLIDDTETRVLARWRP